MIKLTELLPLENIKQGLICSSKKRAFEIIGEIADTRLYEDLQENHTCFECLLEREKLGNSSLGNGVAFPKGRLSNGTKPIAVFLQLKEGIDYNALDHRDIDLIFALLVPSKLCSEFTEELSQITKILTDKTICKQLRAAQSEEEIWNILKKIDSQQQNNIDDQVEINE